MSRSIVNEIFINAPVDAVWRALTDAEELTRWFPVEARVTPGVGGSISLSWGGDADNSAPITVWEPGQRFQWTEARGPIKLVVDFHLEARGGGTVVRLVQSGFGSGADWDGEYHMTQGGWSYFVEHLRWYLERHRATPRDLIAHRERVPLSGADAFRRLLGPGGLSADGALSTVEAGARYRTSTASGDLLTGTVVALSRETQQMGLTIEPLGNAILFLEMEPAPPGVRAGFWLSTYGLDASTLAAARARYGALYRQALGI